MSHIRQSVLVFTFAVLGPGLCAQGTGPWQTPLMIAHSTDGTLFTNHKIFQDSSGVPSIARVSSSQLIAAFQWFPAPYRGRHWDSVAVKFSNDDGLSWSRPSPIVVTGMPSNFQRPFDPAVTYTDEARYRIYFSSGPLVGSPGLTSNVDTYSAVSVDGVNYVFEPGPRFDELSRIVIDPSVIKFNGKWHLIVPIGAPQEGAYHATSGDGLNFTKEAVIASDNQHNWTGNILQENLDFVRFYGSGPRIWWSRSPDAFSWSPYTATNVPGGDPATIQLTDGSYLMVYVGPRQVVAIDQNEMSYWVKAYPNPVDDTIYIAINQGVNNVNMKLFDMMGRMALTDRIGSTEHSVRVAHLAAGIYLAVFSNESGALQTCRIHIAH